MIPGRNKKPLAPSLIKIALLSTLGMISTTALSNDLIFSEYAEGSSNNKAIEIFNGTGQSINLSDEGYRLELYTNGSATVSQSLLLSGVLANDDVLVLCHNQMAAATLPSCDITNGTVIAHNGDDAYVLRKASTAAGVGTIVDSFGDVGTDPGNGWGAGDYVTNDRTLRRKPSVCNGDTIISDGFADPSIEWDSFPNNTHDGLGSHTVTCNSSPALPSISIANLNVNEGDGTVNFDITLSAAASSPVTFDITSTDGTATSPDDFSAITATGVTIPTGDTSVSVSLVIVDDVSVEGDESFTLSLSNAAGATIDPVATTATITIIDNDVPALPTLSIVPSLSQNEGDSGTTPFAFDVSLSEASTQAITVIATASIESGDTASTNDLALGAVTLTFPANSTSSQQAIFQINGDTDVEQDETFTVTLSAATNAEIAQGTSTGTILNDDTAAPAIPQLVISQIFGGGNSGSLTNTPNQDYVEIFNRGEQEVSLDGMSLFYSSATGTGNFAQAIVFSNQHTIAAGQYFLVGLKTRSTGIAIEPDANNTTSAVDIAGANGKLVLVTGSSALPCNGGSIPCNPAELDRFIDLVGFGTANYYEGSAAAPAASASTAIFRKEGGCTDTNDNSADFDPASSPTPRNKLSPFNTCNSAPALPELSIANLTVNEGDGTVNFDIALSAVSTSAVTFDVASTDGTAISPDDFAAIAANGVTIPAGQTSANVALILVDDTLVEGDETFSLTLSNPVGATLLAGADTATITIRDNDVPPPPTLSIVSNANSSEGNSGTTPIAFEVSISEAYSQEATVVATASIESGNTASSNDLTLGSVTLTFPANSTASQSAVFLINGDTDYEQDETFTVTLSAASNAVIDQAISLGTILNDDDMPAFTPISSIQGSGATSPLVNSTVTTRGIVTAISSNNRNVFIQSQTADEDGDPATSEGLYLFGSASNLIGANLVVGDFVYATGNLIEYSPATGALPITEISNPTVTKYGSDYVLPTPVVLTAADLDPNGPIDALERYEFMRVTAPSLTVTAPTGAGTNDEFFAVLTGMDRPMREAGVNAFRCGVNPDIAGSIALPPEAPANVPCWDNNPELLRVKSNLLRGGLIVPYRAGTELTQVTGVLDYAFQRYTIATTASEAGTVVPNTAAEGTATPLPTPKQISIATYNAENLSVAGGTAYTRKANKVAQAIVNYMHTPDVIGMIEIGNIDTLNDISTRVSAIAANDPMYQSVMVSTSGTQRLGFLIKKSLVGTTPRVSLIGEPQEYGADLNVLCPDGVSYTTGLLNDRAPLVMEVAIQGENGASWNATIINNHLKSMIDLESTADADAAYACFNDAANPGGGEGRRNRAKRQQNAEFLAELVSDLQSERPSQPIILVGDFNAYHFSDGLADLLGTIKGQPSANDETVVPDDGADLVNPDLILLTETVEPSQQYSYTFEGNPQAIDHILINEATLSTTVGDAILAFARVNADFHQGDVSDTNSVFGASDHDPAVVLLDIAAFRTADLAVVATDAVTPTEGQVWSPISVSMKLVNQATTDNAEAPTLTFNLPSAVILSDDIVAPADWTCSGPDVGLTGTIFCQADEALAAQAEASTFTFEFTPTQAASGQTLTLTAQANTSSTDSNESNNEVVYTIQIEALPEAIFADGFED